jgi:hypothetical protein
MPRCNWRDAMNLTRRQLRFVDEFIVTRCGAEAARRAGYSTRTVCEMAYENLRKPQIVAALAAKEAELALRLEIDRDIVVAGIFGAIADARMEGNAGVVIRGWCAVAQMLGLDTAEVPKRAMSANGERLLAQFAAMTTEELVEIAQAGARCT